MEETSGRSSDREVDGLESAGDMVENGGDGRAGIGKADSFGFAPPPSIGRSVCVLAGSVQPIRLRTLRTAVSVTPIHIAIWRLDNPCFFKRVT